MTISLAGLNSLSLLGTPFADLLPKFLTNNPLPNGYPWGTHNATNTNPYTTRPDTGVTRHYDWTITKHSASPDGVPNELLLVNGQFPGPTLEANWGDWVEVTVHNNLSTEGTGVHWHGLLQQESPWMDGIPGVTQCPIAPGSSFTYKFKPDLYGSSWYHSHYQAQYASGFLGPMVIYGPQTAQYDLDLGPVVVQDYYHKYYTDIEAGILAKDATITASDNNLINGKNSFMNNSAPLASFNFTTSRKMRLRLINTSAFAVQKVSIDSHSMTVIANDFVPLNPYTTDVVTLAPGQRTDVIVQGLSDPRGAYWLRAYKPTTCSPAKPNGLLATAAIFYEKADRTAKPTSQPGTNAYDKGCGNDDLAKTVPLYPIPVPEPSYTEVAPIVFKSNGTSTLWYMKNQTARIDYNDPVLLNENQGRLSFEPIRGVHDYGSNSSIRFILENPGAQPHPVHLHGHNMFVLQEGACASSQLPSGVFKGDVSGQNVPKGAGGSKLRLRMVGDEEQVQDIDIAAADGGDEEDEDEDMLMEKRTLSFLSRLWGKLFGAPSNKATSETPSAAAGVKGHCWDGSVVNAANPQRRDVQMLLPGHYLVVQWNQDNPGVWPLHCHIAWHIASGFVWLAMEQPDKIRNQMNVPKTMPQTCTDWQNWSKSNIVDQIDDGI